MRLALKVVLATVLGTLAVLICFGYLRIRREIALFDSDLRHDHGLIGATLAVCVAATWASTGPERALDLVTHTNAERPYLTISWIYPDGRYAPNSEFRAPMTLGSLHQVEHRVIEVPEQDDRDAESYLVTLVPVRDRGELLGAVQVAESLRVRDDYVAASIYSTGLATLSMVLVSGVVVLVSGVWIVGRPLRSLANKANRIGRGDLMGPLELKQRDEIGALAREMNAMCDRLLAANEKTQAETLARIAALEQLRHADRLITVGRLAAGIAHELGTPLNVITGRVKMLRRGGLEQSQVDEYLGVVADQAERMATIIRQLMDFARRREPKIGAADLTLLASQIKRLVAPLAERRGVRVLVSASEPVLARGDALQLEQVLSNLVVNAIHACGEGGTVEIACGLREEEPGQLRAFVRVTDDGHGMDQATKERIFEPFFTTKEVGQGTGLGLSVAHGIVQEHGGSVRVESQPGHGSTFSIFLPMAAT